MNYTQKSNIFKLVFQSKIFNESELSFKFFDIEIVSISNMEPYIKFNLDVKVPENKSWYYTSIISYAWRIIDEYCDLAGLDFYFKKTLHVSQVFVNDTKIKFSDYYLNKESRLKIIEILESRKFFNESIDGANLKIYIKLNDFTMNVNENVYIYANYSITEINASYDGKTSTINPENDFNSDIGNWIVDNSENFENFRMDIEDDVAGEVLNKELGLNIHSDSYLSLYTNIINVYGEDVYSGYNRKKSELVDFLKNSVLSESFNNRRH